METKPLLFGLIGFFIGGLLVSVAATTFNKPVAENAHMSMAQMANELNNKNGDDFDEAFISSMIEHHEGAVDMAKQAEAQAKHAEIKQLSKEIIAAQQAEITQMKAWQKDWGYSSNDANDHSAH